MRIFAISDLHADFAENWVALGQLSQQAYQNDVVLIAGDIADHLSIISKTLSLFRARFRQVFYIPGNHELWTRADDCNSLEKLKRILAICYDCGVSTRPARAGELWVIPLLSWYEAGFDENQSTGVKELEGWADDYFCKWPSWIDSVADYFLRANSSSIKSYDRPVITFSHFLPRRDLLPKVSKLKFKGLPQVAGCAALDEQIRAVNSVIHIFGHTHIRCDRVIDGIRYVQSALGYPGEKRSLRESLKLIWSSGER